MLHHLPEQTLQQSIKSSLLTRSPQNKLTQFNIGHEYRDICNLLLSLTRSSSLKKGLQLHAQIIKSGIQLIPLLSHHLINFYSKSQLPFDSCQVFQETQFKSVTGWSSVISSFAQNELPFCALDYFRRMLVSGFRPDDHILPSATKACGIVGEYVFGKSVHCLAVKIGYDSDVFVGSSVVDMYAKCGETGDARKVFDEMPEKNIVSWSGMICGYAQVGEGEEALGLFKQALVEELDVNDFTFSGVIKVCGNSTLLELGKQLHGLCLKIGYNDSSFVGSSLISLYSKCGIIEGAYKVFDEKRVRILGMWNAMLIACAQHSHTNKALDLFKQMRNAGMKPNFITFLYVLYACSHAGLVKEGMYYFELMKQHGIEPGDHHYTSLVDLLSRANKLEEALSIIKKMPMQPSESVWVALLTGCRLHGNSEIGAYAADRVFELGPVRSGMHVLLFNVYAAAGRYEEAAKVRKMLRDRGVKKETGLSWVEEGNKVHTFSAGERGHSKSKEIYLKLEELEDEMERAGYVPDTSLVMREVDDEEKSLAIRYHSERLALAFALITFSVERPIRIMKNLRVCGDCHTVMKFISKCSGRVIIVRDNNRFHQFEDGKCSCNDYW